MKGHKVFALTQTISLVVTLFAFSFMISSIPFTTATITPTLRSVPGGESSNPNSAAIDRWATENPAELEFQLKDFDADNYEEPANPGLFSKLYGTGAAGITMFAGKTVLGIMKAAGWVIGSGSGGTLYVSADGVITYGANMGIAGTALTAIAGAAAGYVVMRTILSLFVSQRNLDTGGLYAPVTIIFLAALTPLLIGGPVGWVAFGAAVILTGIFMAAKAQKYSSDSTQYISDLWQPQYGGEHCSECEDLPHGCSEYQCHTFGLACELINQDRIDEKCVWGNKDNFDSTNLTILNNLPSEDYEYKEIGGTEDNYKITYNGHCIPPHQGIEFGVNSSEYTMCRYEVVDSSGVNERPSNDRRIEDYTNSMMTSSFIKEHIIRIPNSALRTQYENLQDEIDYGAETADLSEPTPEDVFINQNVNYTYYIQCVTKNGVQLPKPFAISFCVSQEADTTAPTIESITPPSESYVQSGITEKNIAVRTNEFANCSWDFRDVPYSEMLNNMQDCRLEGYEYTCKTTLVNITEGSDTKYYIRCQDKPFCNESYIPTDGTDSCKKISNAQSEEYIVKSSQALVIDDLTIGGMVNNSIIQSSTSFLPVIKELEVHTSGGFSKYGLATCQFRRKGNNVYTNFNNDGVSNKLSINKRDIGLHNSTNSINVKCCDGSGNCDTKDITVNVELDNSPPRILRAISTGSNILLITSEEAKCVYSVTGCNYDFVNGTNITTTLSKEHIFTNMNIPVAYIKCEDKYKNVPADCSIKITAE